MLLDTNWRFHLGDLESAYEKDFPDADWRQVTVPHDWSVEYPKDRHLSSGTGYVIGGTAWYRRHFSIPAQTKGNKFFLCFDGVYKNSQVWINGYYLGRRPNGYISFRYDVTNFLSYGETENVIAVRVSHEDIADSRWFTGSGITRKVTLQKFGRVYPQEYGIFFQTPEANEEYAKIEICNELVLSELTAENTAEVTVQSTLFDADSHAAAVFETAAVLIKGKPESVITGGTLSSVQLWAPNHPNLYTLRTTVVMPDGNVELVDQQKVGIRSICFDPDKGFFINKKPDIFKGVCLHHDGGALGAAMTKGVWRRRLEKLKAMGCNAIRTSHNPHAPELYELCDEMGFFMIDEAFDEWEGCKNKWYNGHNVYPPKHQGYANDFPEWHERDLTAQVRRDRNHPSVVMWSIGNEIDYPNDPYNHPSFQTMTGNNDANKPEEERRYHASRPNMERLAEISKRLTAIVKQSDTTRPVTAAVAFPELSANLGYIDHLDVVGYNYKEHLYEQDHRRFPDKPFLGSENGHAYHAWKQVLDYPYISGQFLWIGIDYLGECSGWPVHTHGSGNLSTAGFERPRYYSRQSWWSEKPVIHICTGRKNAHGGEWKMVSDSWNYIPGEEIEVRCYTNCSDPILSINDSPIAEAAVYNKEFGFYQWFVTFVPGKLTASAIPIIGKSIDYTKEIPAISHSLETVGAPVKLAMEAVGDEDIIQVEISVLDAESRLVCTDQSRIDIHIEGPHEYLGLDNGDIRDTTDYRAAFRNALNGRLMLYLRKIEDIPVKITAYNPYLKHCSLEV